MDFQSVTERYIQALKTWDGTATSNAQTIALSHHLFHHAHPHHPTLEEAARLLSRAFSLAASDRRQTGNAVEGKLAAALPLAVILLRVYFILGTTRLCGNVVRAIKTSAEERVLVGAAGKAVQAKWWYFCGRLHLDSLSYGEALQAFVECCRVCLRGSRQFAVSLSFLVVTAMIGEGRVPSRVITQSVLPPPVAAVVSVVRLGDYKQLQLVVERDRQFWLQNRLYLLCRLHLKDTCLRNLLKRTVSALGLLKEARVPLRAFHAACRLCVDADTSFDEAECLLAGLIASGRVRGYISREHSTLVLSKKNPFPTSF